jgi:DNA polymerase III sliding clamp (beta) subunit (PCNA family)
MTHKEALKQIIDRIYEYEADPIFQPNELAQWEHLLTIEPEAKAPVKRCKTNTIPKPVDWLKAAQIVNGKCSCLPILNTFLVQNGKAVCTNMEQSLMFPTDLPDGFYVKVGSKLMRTEEFSDPEDFPTFVEEHDIQPGYSQTLPTAALFHALTACQAAQSTDEARYILNGVFLVRREACGAVKVAATDGRRLHLCTVEDPKDCEEPFAWVIPTPAVKILLSVLKDRAGDIRFSVIDELSRTDSKTGEKFYEPFAVSITLPDGGELITKLIEGIYPTFEQVIVPEDATCIRYNITSSPWLSAIKELEPVRKYIKKVTGECETAYLTFNRTGETELSLTSTIAGYEKTAVNLPKNEPVLWTADELIEGTEADPKRKLIDSLRICLNIDFLSDLLKTLPEAGGQLDMTDDLSPIVLRSDKTISVLMPIRCS